MNWDEVTGRGAVCTCNPIEVTEAAYAVILEDDGDLRHVQLLSASGEFIYEDWVRYMDLHPERDSDGEFVYTDAFTPPDPELMRIEAIEALKNDYLGNEQGDTIERVYGTLVVRLKRELSKDGSRDTGSGP